MFSILDYGLMGLVAVMVVMVVWLVAGRMPSGGRMPSAPTLPGGHPFYTLSGYRYDLFTVGSDINRICEVFEQRKSGRWLWKIDHGFSSMDLYDGDDLHMVVVPGCDVSECRMAQAIIKDGERFGIYAHVVDGNYRELFGGEAWYALANTTGSYGRR